MSSASNRKRQRVEAEDIRAECPFTATVVDPDERDSKKKKKRRRTENGALPPQLHYKVNLQMSPFAPCGKFKTHETMDVYYKVEPLKKWTEMTRYNSFVLNGVKYFSEGFIYVANDSSIERQKTGNEKAAVHQPRQKSDDDWVARILEIRASDEHHVYARIFWMYWPDELPQGTHDGKRQIQSRQPYHGMNELIASNHMDIINVVSVTSQATVKQWYEENDEEIQNALYWRQAFDLRTYELSTVDLVCSCNTPANPDKKLLGCTDEACKKWMHEQCVLDDILGMTYNQLGTDKPYIPPEPKIVVETVEPKKVEEDTEGRRPLSPVEPDAAVSAQQSIEVKSGGLPSNGSGGGDGEDKLKEQKESAPVVPEDTASLTASGRPRRSASEKADPEPPVNGKTTTPKLIVLKRGGPAKKKKIMSSGDASQPWYGLFEAYLCTEKNGPPTVEVRDLREGVVGGVKTWVEPVTCLLCGNKVN
ncbi:hypothetical protein QBC38DRAFT_364020 [Podospora fimiseda]|uniref:BAH domain-containing protein n=1 Tax=Podospora fimiseda TaxID=252190 RepID=A0AAN7BQ90_9PEZI|nr:hypothetical protein QBC38DRAFT_364020 [Podospora fimiseda]